MIDEMVCKMAAPERVMNAVLELLRQADSRFEEEHQAFTASVDRLRGELAGEQLNSLEEYLAEEERSMAGSLMYLFWKGVRQNYDCFVNSVNKLFLKLDYEDIHQEGVMRSFVAFTYENTDRHFEDALSDELKALTDSISSYYAYLQTVAYKLAHYFGFRFADTFLAWVAPGYTPDYVTTSVYGAMIKKDLDLDGL